MQFENAIAFLYDEKSVEPIHIGTRRHLADRFRAIELGPKLKHLHYLQAQTGCFNACSFCAQDPGKSVWYFDEPALRNVLSALKTVAIEYEVAQGRVQTTDIDSNGHWLRSKPAGGILGYARPHRPGHIFCYLDDEPFSYPYLDTYLSILKSDFGSKVRATTVSYSRKNAALSAMHDSIAGKLPETLASLRLSVTPYTLNWRNSDQSELPGNSFARDLTHMLRQYAPLREALGYGKKKFCIEMRTPPLIERGMQDLQEAFVGGCWTANVGSYTVIGRQPGHGPPLKSAQELLQAGRQPSNAKAYILAIASSASNLAALVQHVRELDAADLISDKFSPVRLADGTAVVARTCSVDRLANIDGEYLSVDGLPDVHGCRMEVNLYPRTRTRTAAGTIYRVRHWLNNLIELKHERGLSRTGEFAHATWDDATIIFDKMRKDAELFETACSTLSAYIRSELIAIPKLVAFAMQHAGYNAADFLGYGFVWDTGAITNLGRALTTIFRGFVSEWYHPLSLNEERGYGYHPESDSGKREPVLRIAPTPSRASGQLQKSDLGFRNPVALPEGGITVELLDKHIQPIESYRHWIPGVSVTLSKSRDKEARFLVPGA
jgi:hypothetical protein